MAWYWQGLEVAWGWMILNYGWRLGLWVGEFGNGLGLEIKLAIDLDERIKSEISKAID